MPDWLQWINPATWTPEWVGAIGSGVAATAAIVALIVTLRLAGKQSRSLQITIDSLTDEMAHRREERVRQRQEQASKIHFKPGTVRLYNSSSPDYNIVQAGIRRAGITVSEVRGRMDLLNASGEPITNVTVTMEGGPAPACYAIDHSTTPGYGPIAVLPPGENARFYWVGNIAELHMVAEFTDAAGVRWRHQYRDGLTELTEHAPEPASEEQ